ncbi:fibrinogen-like protein A [Crassostrea angulata]|uniref:fibrinogen-like protein A n=1 Tax=Magallana angulata TaxID=2784310 RepID=UPI0022B1F46E|nr:fibrinogen-like protein A [Crassostrea angulata]
MKHLILLLCFCFVSHAVRKEAQFVFRGFSHNDSDANVAETMYPGGREPLLVSCPRFCAQQDSCMGYDLCDVGNSTVCRLFDVEGCLAREERSRCRYFEKVNISALEFGNDFRKEVTTTAAVHVTGIGGDLSSDCADCGCLSGSYTTSGLYQVTLGGQQLTVECVKVDGTAHTVIYHRHDGSLDFNRTYAEYENGFGSASSENWLGNKYIHLLTQTGNTVLRIEVKFVGSLLNTYSYAIEYSHFSVGNASTAYKLDVSGYSGLIGDVMTGTNGAPFSTRDLDNSPNLCGCANRLSGGWWYLCCSSSQLTMPYNGYNKSLSFGWSYTFSDSLFSFTATTSSIASVKMMLRKT